MSYHHFTTFERGRIQELLSLGYSHRKIAQKLHRNRSSIDREIQWNLSGVNYIAEVAQSLYHARRKHSKPKGKHTDVLADIIVAKHEATWSPEQIANTVMLGIVTFVERKSRLYTAFKMRDRTATSMQTAITALYKMLPKGAFKTGTTDRGKEFACCTNIEEQLGLTLYFADAYSSWQRGSNENSNGLLREFYPKRTDLALVSQEDLTQNLFLINSRPRKCLGWKSPIQVFLHEVAHLT